MNPNISKNEIDVFLKILKAQKKERGNIEPKKPKKSKKIWASSSASGNTLLHYSYGSKPSYQQPHDYNYNDYDMSSY